MRWGTTPQKGCVLALPLGVFPGSLHCSRGAAKAPKASALHPVSPAPARTGPPGETGLPARSLCFPPPAPPTPWALRSPRCTCPQEPATCSAREVPFERQLLSPPWVVFWEHKRRKAVRLGEFSLLPCVPASTAGARQVRSGGGLGAERGVRRRPLSAHPPTPHPPPLEGPDLSLRAKIPIFRASLVSLGFSRCP